MIISVRSRPHGCGRYGAGLGAGGCESDFADFRCAESRLLLVALAPADTGGAFVYGSYLTSIQHNLRVCAVYAHYNARRIGRGINHENIRGRKAGGREFCSHTLNG